VTAADEADLTAAVIALEQGRADEAIGKLEALADRGVVGAGIAFDRGLAYASRARGGLGLAGDLGRSAHAFEEALRREPHDSAARTALDEVRKEIARRDVAAGWKAEEVGAPPMWRALVIAAPGDVWTAMALVGAAGMSIALAFRPRVQRGLRLAASTVAIVALVVTAVSAALGLGARYLRSHVHEAVVVTPSTLAKRDEGEPLRLVEGTRVDVLEERLTEAHVRMEKGDGWVPRSALRALPPYRP